MKGGARNRSGPRPSEDSGRSDRRGYKLTALPAAGYDGEVPDFPLPSASDREIEVWGQVWRTPQACAWSLPSEAWRQRTVALWVRTSVRCEDPEAGAALLGQLHRFADQIGMTTAGLGEMGWKVAPEEVGATEPVASEEPDETPTRQRRLRAVGDGGE